MVKITTEEELVKMLFSTDEHDRELAMAILENAGRVKLNTIYLLCQQEINKGRPMKAKVHSFLHKGATQ